MINLSQAASCPGSIADSLMLLALLLAPPRWPVAAAARRRVQRRCLVVAVPAQCRRPQPRAA